MPAAPTDEIANNRKNTIIRRRKTVGEGGGGSEGGGRHGRPRRRALVRPGGLGLAAPKGWGKPDQVAGAGRGVFYLTK